MVSWAIPWVTVSPPYYIESCCKKDTYDSWCREWNISDMPNFQAAWDSGVGGRCIPGLPPGVKVLMLRWTGWHHLQPHVTEWCPEQCHLVQFTDSTGQALPQTWSLFIYLQPELKIKSRACKDVFLIKNKTFRVVLLEPKCQHDYLENVSFYCMFSWCHIHLSKGHFDFSLLSAWHTSPAKHSDHLGLNAHMQDCE